MSQKISVELELIDNISRNWDAVMSRLAKGTSAVQSETRQLSTAARVTETSLRAETQAAANLNPILRQTENISGLLSAQLQQLTAHAAQNATGLRAVSASVDSLAESMRKSNLEGERAKSTNGGIGLSLGTLRAAYATAAGVIGGVFLNSLMNAGLQAERMERTLRVASGGAIAGQQAFAFVRQEADRLGVDLTSSAQAFAKMTAAARGTRLEGQATREIFVGVSAAAGNLGLSAHDVEGALNAIQQMISKGTVQAEELRGQLGERLPGAFQMAARAMGMTTQELGKAMERGEVFAEDLIPRMAEELKNTYPPAQDSATKSITAFKNEMQVTTQTVGQVFLTMLGGMADGYMKVSEAVQAASTSMGGHGGALLGQVQREQAAAQDAERAVRMKALEEANKLREQEREKTAGPNAAQSKVIEENEKADKKAREKAEKDAKAAAERQKQLTIEARRALQDAEAAAIEDQNLREIAAMELKYARLFEEAKGNKEAERALNQAFDLEAETQAREHAEKLSKARLQAVVKARKEEEDALKQESADRRKQEKEDADSLNRRYAASQAFFGGMSQLMMAAAGKNKQLAAAAKAVAIGEAVANTYVAANKALASAPPPFNFIAMAGVIAAGLANVIKIQSAKGFREGGYTGEGSPGDVAGVVHRKEFVFDAAATSRIGRGNLEAMRRGLPVASSSSHTTHISAPLTLVLQGPTPQETIDQATNTYFDRLREFKRMQRDAVDLEVPEMA